MIDEDRIRARLQRAIGYEPPSPSFGAQHLSKLAAGGWVQHDADESRHSNLLALVAAVLAVAIVVTLVLGARALHFTQITPVHPGPHLPLITSNNQPCGGSGSAGPVELFGSGAGWASGPSYLPDFAGPYRTTDGGVQWINVAPPAIASLSPYGETEFFLDSNHAWVAEAAGSGSYVADHVVVFSTSDGGQTWLRSAALQITPFDRSDVIWEGSGNSHWMCFIDSRNGWLLIESGPASPLAPTWRTGVLYRTTDGGVTWALIARNPGSSVLKTLGGGCSGGFGIGDGIIFSSSVTGWLPIDGCASPDAILVTHDGGVTWSAQHMPLAYPTLPYFIDSEHGVLAGQPSVVGSQFAHVIATTSDGGVSWATQPALPDQCGDVTFIDQTTGWCIGRATSAPDATWIVLQTTDGGRTWVKQSEAPDAGGQLTFADAKTGYLSVGEYPDSAGWMLFRTVDAGLTWTRIG